MDCLSLRMISTANTSSFIQPLIQANKLRILPFSCRKTRKFSVLASKDEPKLDEWDQMELRFGRMIGEDRKITLSKIMGRKANPDMSYLEIEKLLDHKKKGKTSNYEVEEIPFDVPGRKKSDQRVQGVNLVRPVPKEGTKFQPTDKQAESDTKKSAKPISGAPREIKSSVPNVILRKPGLHNEENDENGKYSKFGMKPNLTLRMWKEPQKERFSDITLMKKPEPLAYKPDQPEWKDPSETGDDKAKDSLGYSMLLETPEIISLNSNDGRERESSDECTESSSNDATTSDSFTAITESQADIRDDGKISDSESASNHIPAATCMDTVLIGKPKRFDGSHKSPNPISTEDVITVKLDNLDSSFELENFITNSPVKEREDADWARAVELFQTGQRQEVELISSSTKGFVASFGSLIGFLPYRNLAARWKFLAFESWLRRKGLDPSVFRQNLGVIGNNEATSAVSFELGTEIVTDHKRDLAVSSDMKLEDLLMIYDQEKLKFLASFVGQRIKVGVVMADRSSRRLIFSIKPKEKEDLVEKKRSLMAQLSVGDVVKCCIKKITYFGIFVEVKGVAALIHQSEVSWDATLDPESYFKVGQIVDAKVHQLDFSLERIFLSLKEITPDPLSETLEAVVDEQDSFGYKLEAAESDTEWVDVESLIKELQQFDGIQSVSKGQYFLSPGLAPTFQVYMTSMFDNQYKLLARAGNRVQEVILVSTLDKEQLKSAILTCTNRVV